MNRNRLRRFPNRPSNDLGIAFQEAPDVGLGIVKNVTQKIGQVARQGIHIRAIPAATRHGRRQSTDKLKTFEVGRRLCQHGRSHPMIAVENGQRTSIVHANQQDRRIHVVMNGVRDPIELASRREPAVRIRPRLASGNELRVPS